MDNVLIIPDKPQSSATEQLLERIAHALEQRAPSEVMDVAECATFLRQSTSTIQKWARAKIIPYCQPVHEKLFIRSEIIEWLQRHKVMTNEEIDDKADAILNRMATQRFLGKSRRQKTT